MSQAEYHSEENLLVKTPVLSLILGSWEIHSTTLRLCLQLLNGTKMVLQIGSILKWDDWYHICTQSWAWSAPNNVCHYCYLEINDETEAIQFICIVQIQAIVGRFSRYSMRFSCKFEHNKVKERDQKIWYYHILQCVPWKRGKCVCQQPIAGAIANLSPEAITICRRSEVRKTTLPKVWAWKKISASVTLLQREVMYQNIDKEREAEDALVWISEHTRKREQTKTCEWRQWGIVGKCHDLVLHKCSLDSILPLSVIISQGNCQENPGYLG